MIPKFTNLEFTQAKSKDRLPLECKCCNIIFYKTKHSVQSYLNPNNNSLGDTCSIKCKGELSKRSCLVKCNSCNTSFLKQKSQIKKSINHFCSHSCSASFNNKNKKFGTRRSKLEKWLEEQLSILYPNLYIEYNTKTAIKSELDIYIPSLNLAFELNGIFHYEPIYGVEKLNKIKNNDLSKSKACHDATIDLCIINTSAQTYITNKTSQKYLDIITKIINERH